MAHPRRREVPPGGEPLDARDDASLLAAHVAGDPEAFAVLVRRHRDRCWAVALRTLGDREEAADAVQDALLAAHRGAASFRGEAQVSTWLHRVVLNACLDRLRRRAARPTVPLQDDLPAHLVAVEPAPVAERLDIAAALAALPEEQRDAIVLVDVQDLPVAMAARLLGVPEGTVKSRCSRGRTRLALALGHLRAEGERDPRERVEGNDRGATGVRATGDATAQGPAAPPVPEGGPRA